MNKPTINIQKAKEKLFESSDESVFLIDFEGSDTDYHRVITTDEVMVIMIDIWEKSGITVNYNDTK